MRRAPLPGGVDADATNSQTKMRKRAIDAASHLAGVSPISSKPLSAFRRGARRMEHAARGSVRPMFWRVSEISAPDMPQDPGPGASGTVSFGSQPERG